MGKNVKRAKYLMKNTAIFTIGSIATKLISFFLVPLYTNVLSTEQYGTADLVSTICMVLAPIVIFNINESILRFSLDKDADHMQILSAGALALGVAVIISLLIVPIINNIPTLSNYTWYIYFYTVAQAGSSIFLCYLRGRELLTKYAVGNVINTLAVAGFNIFFLLVIHQGLKGYFKAYIFASIVTMVYAIIAGDVGELIGKFNINKKLIASMVQYSVVLIPNTFMWWIMNSLDRVMVTTMISAAANGIYAVSSKLPSIVNTFSSIFNQAWGYSAIHEDESPDRDQYSNNVYNGLVAVGVISGVGLMFVMKPFLAIYVEKSYFEAWKYTSFLIIGNVFLTFGTFLGTPYIVNKNSKGYLFSATSGALVNVLLNAILIPLLGIAGAALATCISYVIVYVYRYIDTKKYIKIHIFQIRHMVAYIIMILTAVFMYINNFWGEALMFFCFIAEIVLFSYVWVPILKFIFRRVRKKL